MGAAPTSICDETNYYMTAKLKLQFRYCIRVCRFSTFLNTTCIYGRFWRTTVLIKYSELVLKRIISGCIHTHCNITIHIQQFHVVCMYSNTEILATSDCRRLWHTKSVFCCLSVCSFTVISLSSLVVVVGVCGGGVSVVTTPAFWTLSLVVVVWMSFQSSKEKGNPVAGVRWSGTTIIVAQSRNLTRK